MISNYSELCIADLENNEFRNLLSIDYWSAAPHFETSLEICVRLLESGKAVDYCFWGDVVPLSECHSRNNRVRNAQRLLHLHHPNLQFEHLESFPPPLNPQEFPAFHHIEQLKNFMWNGVPAGISAASTLVDLFKTSTPDFRQELVRKSATSALITFATAFKLTLAKLTSSRFDALILFNGRYPSYAGSRYAALHLNIPTFFHERGSDNFRYLFTKDMPHAMSEMNLRLRHGAKQLLQEICLPSASNDIFNHRWFENRIKFSASDLVLIKQRILGTSTTQDKKVITYFMTSNDEIGSLPKDVYPDMYWTTQEGLISDLLSVFSMHSHKVHLVVRMHPNLVNKQSIETDRFNHLKNSPYVSIIYPDDHDINSYALAELSDAVLVHCSTIGIECAYMNKPVFCLSPSYYDFLKVVSPIKSYQQLSGTISSIINDKFKSSGFFDPSLRFRCNIFGQMKSSSGVLHRYYSPRSSNQGTFLNVSL